MPQAERPAIDRADVEALTRRLVAIPSISPDPDGEARCGDMLASHLPADIPHGVWSTRDGRPVVWALARGRKSAKTVILLGHYDTVGTDEFAALDEDQGGSLAFDPVRLRSVLLERRALGVTMPADLAADLDEEARAPGTWMFGRGALDMKSGLAAGVGALESLSRGPLEGNVLFVATPDEEHASAGMNVAVHELVRLRAARDLDYVGVLNLDYCPEPCGFHGLMGKMAVGCLVLGTPAHAGAPGEGVDAAQLAAAIALGATTTPLTGLAEPGSNDHAPLPSLIQLRDLKQTYDAQTTAEAIVELNLISSATESTWALNVVRAVVTVACKAWASTVRAAGRQALPVDVHLVSELTHDLQPAANGEAALITARARTLELVRRRVAHVARPAVVIFLFPPYYPASAPRESAVALATRPVLAREGMPMLGRYPYISDASYVAWQGESVDDVARHLPVLGDLYRVPHAAAAALDLDVVNVGPWGRGAHGLYERVNARFAFGRLPGLIAEIAVRACSDADAR
jgi:arginine utilization protein RocB